MASPFILIFESIRTPWRRGPACLSWEDFDKLRSGEEEESLEVGLKSWCIVKLDGVRPAGRSTCTCSLES